MSLNINERKGSNIHWHLLINYNLKFIAAILLIIFFGLTFVEQIVKLFIN